MTKRWLYIIAGWCVIIIGILLIPLPGPGLLVILGGLTLLSRELLWARKLAAKLKKFIKAFWGRRKKRK